MENTNIKDIINNMVRTYLNEASGRSKNPTPEQQWRYDQEDKWNNFFRENPLWIMAVKKGTAYPVPIQVIGKAVIDPRVGEDLNDASVRLTAYDADKDTRDENGKLIRQNHRWKELTKTNDNITRDMPFRLDMSPVEVLQKMVKYYNVIKVGELSAEERIKFIQQSFDQLQKDQFGKTVESVNRKVVRLTESELHNIIKSSVKKILKETSLYYDEDNFSGRYTRNNNTEEITSDVFVLEINDSNKSLYLFGKMPIDNCMMCQRDAERWGNGSYIDFYEDENLYNKTINNYLQQGYTITNQQ